MLKMLENINIDISLILNFINKSVLYCISNKKKIGHAIKDNINAL